MTNPIFSILKNGHIQLKDIAYSADSKKVNNLIISKIETY
ncbi:MAG: hypothetical protein ACJAZM_002594 [Cyclobacteriaceae bacterium]|jgi:hypothetical protein